MQIDQLDFIAFYLTHNLTELTPSLTELTQGAYILEDKHEHLCKP